MSSCLSGGGRTYGFDLDIMKSPSPSARSSHSSSPSSTLSESSNSPRAISTKRPRTPRKRPNQTYNEAAVLLSTVYPNIFSTKNLRKLCNCKQTKPYDAFSDSSELLPPFPALSDAGFLILEPSPQKPNFQMEPKSTIFFEKACQSRSSNEFQEPNSPRLPEDDFDAESILDEEIGEGIDSIMGNLSVKNNNNDEDITNSSGHITPYIRNLMGFGFGGKFEYGFGSGHGVNMRRALRNVGDGDWWRSPKVEVLNIAPKFKAQSVSSSEKKKKKVEKVEVRDLQTTTTTLSLENLKSGLLLQLNHEEVLKAWSDRGSPFSDGPDSPESSADILARLAQIDLFPENGSGGVREASVMRYKEKRRTRLFSKKIRYQVRKVNADRRPRMKASGRFVRRPSLLH